MKVYEGETTLNKLIRLDLLLKGKSLHLCNVSPLDAVVTMSLRMMKAHELPVQYLLSATQGAFRVVYLYLIEAHDFVSGSADVNRTFTEYAGQSAVKECIDSDPDENRHVVVRNNSLGDLWCSLGRYGEFNRVKVIGDGEWLFTHCYTQQGLQQSDDSCAEIVSIQFALCIFYV